MASALPFRRHRRETSSLAGLGKLPSPGRLAGRIALGAAGLALSGFALYFIKERSQEEAGHQLLETDGAFSLRRYDRLVVAAVRSVGTLAQAMDQARSARAGSGIAQDRDDRARHGLTGGAGGRMDGAFRHAARLEPGELAGTRGRSGAG
jgi:hypothetical protein